MDPSTGWCKSNEVGSNWVSPIADLQSWCTEHSFSISGFLLCTFYDLKLHLKNKGWGVGMGERNEREIKMRMRNGKRGPQLFLTSGLERRNWKNSFGRMSFGCFAPNTQKWKKRMWKWKKQAAKQALRIQQFSTSQSQ